jgi:Na+/H+-dicarboxylate symporter
MSKAKKKMSTSMKMFIGMVLGLVVGMVVGSPITVIKPFGTIYINMLKMTMVPIVFVAITLSIANLDDVKKFGRIALKTFLVYCVTTVLAACIGLCYVSAIRPGIGFTNVTGDAVSRDMPNMVDTLMGIIPTNIIKAMADSSLLSIIFFSIMFGLALSMIGEKKKPVVELLSSLQDAIIKLVQNIMVYAPIGVFALMASIAGQYGTQIFSTLGKFLLTDYLGYITQVVIVYTAMLAMCKINIVRFIVRAKDAIITAATTTSSAATVPVELNMSESHLGVPKEVGGFAFPFGSTINQNGTAINITCCVLFSAQVYGFHFTPGQLISLIAMALISSIGNSGIPGGGTVFTLMILGQFGIPTEAFGMIIACYTLVDIGSTTMNIIGDMVSAIFVSKSEGILNHKVWEEGYVIAERSES